MAAAELDARTEMLRIIQTVVAEVLAETHGTAVTAIEPSRHLTDFATDSVQMLQIHARLSDVLGLEIDASVLFEYDTVAALADHLAGRRLASCHERTSTYAARAPW